MLEVLLGISLALVGFEVFDEWRERRLSRKRLANMRALAAAGRPWDALRGRWTKT